ncbi:MAG TPA: right-handed parallel beta-helix repeat-containing protein [Rhizomicrobium sp.]|nr:right-handed parallel beta-helix repeat-containing protein [Rhizomicrobium sp.]
MRKSVQLMLLLPVFLWGSPASSQAPQPAQTPGNILSVGPGMAFALPSDAARAARSGDTIRIAPGTYSDCARWDADDLIVEGLGDGATITDKVCDDKGLFITRGRNITIRNITFLAARASSHNGSGIRAEGAVLLVQNSRFIDNEDGILAGNDPSSSITVRNSLFKGNGNCIAACAHGIYAGHIALLRVENSQFEEQHVGHHIKSRAARTEVVNNTVHDGPNGTASYLVDLPNGGSAVISGNKFEKGPRSDNKKVAISIGAEGPRAENPPGDIAVTDNAFVNDTGVPTAFVKNYTAGPVTLEANRLTGDVTPLSGPDKPAGKPATAGP